MDAGGLATTAAGRSGRRAILCAALAAVLVLGLSAPARGAVAAPRLTSVASSSVPVGGSITDTAVLIGASKPTGTVTFALYDASDPKCSRAPVFTSVVPVTQPTVSGAYTPTRAGTYSWIATYGGDGANAKAASMCGDPTESVQVSPLTPSVTTVASASVTVGGAISDTAVLTGAFKPTGTVTFRLFGVSDPSCAGAPVFTSTVAVATPTFSAQFSAPLAGTYHFVAAYSGDAANTAASSGCADPAEAVVVTSGTLAKPPPPPPGCDAAGMARALASSLVAVLTGTPGSSFQAACSAGVRIVLRAKEIRPGNPGFPRGDGFTTMANTLTHSSIGGPIAFSFNSQGVALRRYARSTGSSLIVFAVVHVRPDRALQSSEAVQIFTLR